MIIEINKKNINKINIKNNGLINKKTLQNEINNNPFANFLLYIENDTIIGYLYYSDIYDRIEINQIEVSENLRRKGYASKLIEELIKKNKNISLEVKCTNTNAINLYKKYNFKEVAKRQGYYKGIDGILMNYEKK